MAKLTLLDPTKAGRPAQELESKLRRFVVGQEEAIHEIVRTYQTHLAGLSPRAALSEIFSSWGRQARARLESSRQRLRLC